MEAYENDAPEEMLLFWHFVVNFVLGTSSFSPLAVTSCVWAGVRWPKCNLWLPEYDWLSKLLPSKKCVWLSPNAVIRKRNRFDAGGHRNKNVVLREREVANQQGVKNLYRSRDETFKSSRHPSKTPQNSPKRLKMLFSALEKFLLLCTTWVSFWR